MVDGLLGLLFDFLKLLLGKAYNHITYK